MWGKEQCYIFLKKKDVCAFKEHYLGASQLNTVKYFSVLQSELISWCSARDIISEKTE
jgi:hypothetical protein